MSLIPFLGYGDLLDLLGAEDFDDVLSIVLRRQDRDDPRGDEADPYSRHEAWYGHECLTALSDLGYRDTEDEPVVRPDGRYGEWFMEHVLIEYIRDLHREAVSREAEEKNHEY
jgi:hypothetical protein